MDFGLAKLTEMAAPTGSSAPTMLGTIAGQVMGTAGYMAPEQVEAGKVDGRTDVFAFGCVLYEMVTGRRSFAGRSTVETLQKIVHEEPAPMAEGDQAMPADLQRLVRKCLAKEPERRYQHADDLVVDLNDLAAGIETAASLASGPAGAATTTAATGRAVKASLPLKLAALLAALVAGILIAAGWGLGRSPAPTPEPLRRFTI